MPRNKTAADRRRDALRKLGRGFPGAHLKSPWPTHKDLAVNDKTFAYLSTDGEPFSISCKLPESHEAAMTLPHTSPTGYGLGRSGWVTATPPEDDMFPMEVFEEWIEESYRAQAPKRLVKELDASRRGAGAQGAAPRKKAAKGRR
jgi:predicted DNA-binding protein (MmcQ/YjbR family)